MKKSILILLTFVPVVVGYSVNRLLLVPVIGMLIFYILPLLTTAFWLYLGHQYAYSTWKIVPSILIGNATGIVSLLVYVWQFLFETDETRNMILAVASQMFSVSVPTYLLGRIAILFESQPNYVGRTSMVALQIIAVIYMIVIFICGYIWGRKNKKCKPSNRDDG